MLSRITTKSIKSFSKSRLIVNFTDDPGSPLSLSNASLKEKPIKAESSTATIRSPQINPALRAGPPKIGCSTNKVSPNWLK